MSDMIPIVAALSPLRESRGGSDSATLLAAAAEGDGPGVEPFREVLARQLAPRPDDGTDAAPATAADARALPDFAAVAPLPVELASVPFAFTWTPPQPLAVDAGEIVGARALAGRDPGDPPAREQPVVRSTWLAMSSPAAETAAAPVEPAALAAAANPVQAGDVPRPGPSSVEAVTPGNPSSAEARAAAAVRAEPPTFEIPATPQAEARAAVSTQPAATERAPSVSVSVPFGRAEWQPAFSERVTWLVTQNLQRADVQIHPPHLGPVEVRVSIAHGEASLAFAAAHGAVREAIQQSLPRLADMLAAGGLALGHVSVGAESFLQQQSRDAWQPSGRPGGKDRDPGPSAAAAGPEPTVRAGRGLVDMFV